VSRDKGNRAAAWVAVYLRAWWPLAEKTPNGVRGPDIENTPGVAFEVKTGLVWRTEWMTQAARNGDGLVSPVVYLPPGCGETRVGNAYGIVPLHVLMQLLEEAGYCVRETDKLRVLDEFTREDSA
jgi:hypothetical protein